MGNPFSDAIQYYTGVGSLGQLGGGAADYASEKALGSVPNVAISYSSTTVAASSSELNIITNDIELLLPLGEVAAATAKVLKAVPALPVSITATAFGAVTCAAGT